MIVLSNITQVMSFKSKYDSWEISRLCTSLDSIVVGGSERLFKAFIDEYSPGRIISDCDSSMFSGKTYKKLGMIMIEHTLPSYWLASVGRNPQRYNWRKKLQLLKKENMSEIDLLKKHKYVKVWGCGNYKFLWVKPS